MSFDYKFTLPWPPTNNRYYRRVGNKTIISADGRKYAKSVRDVMLVNGLSGKRIDHKVEMTIVYFEPDRRVRDVDGLQKALFDSLTKCGFWVDDRLVKRPEMLMIDRDSHDIKGGLVAIGVNVFDKKSALNVAMNLLTP